MAAVLKEALPDATRLVLAFDVGGPMSPGTARTMARSLRLGQHGGRVRRNGVIEEVPLAHRWRRIDLAGSSVTAVAVPCGDLATAWFSTGRLGHRMSADLRCALFRRSHPNSLRSKPSIGFASAWCKAARGL
jgi:short subunit dehydrogenase-like uncharacterized protein